jgi:PilZ domain
MATLFPGHCEDEYAVSREQQNGAQVPAEFQERRRHVRHAVDLGVEVRTPDAKSGYWGTLGDISLGGCYVYTFSPLPSGSAVVLRMKINESEAEMLGKVAAFHPGVGMGIEFQQPLAEDAEQGLKVLIAAIEKNESAAGTA